MSVQSESIVGLVGRLCEVHLGPTQRSHLVQPSVDREACLQQLKRKAFDTLFCYLNSPESKQSGVGVGGVRTEIDAVLNKVYQLRVARQFEQADRLEHLLEHYRATSPDSSGCVLQFLVGLAETGTPQLSSPLGHDVYNTPVLSEDTKKQTTLPPGALCYGDSQQVCAARDASLMPYMHFPARLFGVHTPDTQFESTGPQTSLSIFSLPPGEGIGGNGLFNTEKSDRDGHEQETRKSLFGGLVQPRATSLAVKLDLPDLSDDSPPEITIPKAMSMSELSEDEGFITTEGSSLATTPGDSGVEDDIWDLALNTAPCRHYVWERIGCEPMATEGRYLTEAGTRAMDELCHLRRHHEHLLAPSSPLPPLRHLSSAHLIKDMVYLLIGIPSHTFPFSQTEDKFTIDTSVTTSGLSTESLRGLVSDLVDSGTHYRRLARFSAARELGSGYRQGLVVQAFHGAVRGVLQHYRAAVLSLPERSTLLSLTLHCDKAVRQIRFLAELCWCAESCHDTSHHAFPLGVELISYLYKETLTAVNTDNYLLMLSLLRTTCQPFVLFVQDWVFHGTFRDVYGEFMIQMNPKFLESRDEQYWEKGYTLSTQDQTASVPTFLSHLAPAIFRCGKALNLLRMCCPRHFLCGVGDSEIPRVSISFTSGDLRDVRVQCEVYVSRMMQVARQLTLTRAEQQRRAADAQKELLETARCMAAMEIARLQGILKARREKEDVKKRKEFQRLKDQMSADLQRRAGEVAEAKQEDRDLMARLTRQEEALTERDIELEQQARDELIAYYTELGEEAARRERRALWRIRRARLETARAELLAADQDRWRTEMAEHLQAQELLHRSDDTDSLPEWAQLAEGATDTVQVGGAKQWDDVIDRRDEDRDWSLPKWAERNLPTPDISTPPSSLSLHHSSSAVSEGRKTAESNLDSSSEDRMPAWARRVLDQGSESSLETLVIADDNHDDQADVPVTARSEGSLVPSLSSPDVLPTSGGGDGGVDGSVPKTPRSARTKASIRMVEGVSTNDQTQEQPARPHIQVSDSVHATAQSSDLDLDPSRPHVKSVPGMSATMETVAADIPKAHITMSGSMHATKETQESTQRPHLKTVADRNANQESHDEIRAIPKLASSSAVNISTETSSAEWRVKKASLYGHVSQLSKQEYSFQAPRLKRQRDLHANLSSDFRDFAVKSGVRFHKHRSATAQSQEVAERPMIRSFKDRHANKESEFVDVEGMRRKRFQEQNVFGHASDSTVQTLLYGDVVDSPHGVHGEGELKQLVPPFDLSALDLMTHDLDTFQDNFDHLNGRPMVDLIAGKPGVVHGSSVAALWQEEITAEEAETIALTPLSVLLQQSLTAPLTAQISLVDEMVVNYFLVDLKIDSHLQALHNYLFMADGDFAQNLTDILLDKLSTSHLPHEMLTPIFLNSALTRALQLSASANQQHADNLSFALRYMPDFFTHNAHDTLDCLELRYKVSWPLNVVLTETSQACYGQVFSFMLQLKRVAWTLTDCWYRLKRDAVVKHAKDSRQFRQLQLHRQEMLHFVRVLQGYMGNQIIQVTWRELQQSLDHNVHSLDDLKTVHADYLNKALFRCLLNKKASKIMSKIQTIFCLILKFCAHLASATWEQDETGEVTHPNFKVMVSDFKAFKKYFVFLFNVVSKLAVRGYQPHLHELLLRLNFNDYYSAG